MRTIKGNCHTLTSKQHCYSTGFSNRRHKVVTTPIQAINYFRMKARIRFNSDAFFSACRKQPIGAAVSSRRMFLLFFVCYNDFIKGGMTMSFLNKQKMRLKKTSFSSSGKRIFVTENSVPYFKICTQVLYPEKVDHNFMIQFRIGQNSRRRNLATRTTIVRGKSEKFSYVDYITTIAFFAVIF